MHLEKKIQIKAQGENQNRNQVGALLFDQSPIKVLVIYFNYSNIFLIKSIAELPEHSEINNYIIKLEKGNQLPFGLIYSLGVIELEILKTYIKINLANDFI